MSDNLFKDHSINAIETCIAKALTELLGCAITVDIGEIRLQPDNGLSMLQGASFTVDATHVSEFAKDSFF